LTREGGVLFLPHLYTVGTHTVVPGKEERVGWAEVYLVLNMAEWSKFGGFSSSSSWVEGKLQTHRLTQ